MWQINNMKESIMLAPAYKAKKMRYMLLMAYLNRQSFRIQNLFKCPVIRHMKVKVSRIK